MSEQTQDDATERITSRRTLLQLAALAGLPLAASDLGRAAASGHLGETWTGSENLDIDVSGSNQGAINLSSEEGFAFKSRLTSNTDSTGTAIYGGTASDSGKAVWAEATNDSGDAMGVYGTSWSPNGYGVYGDDGGAGGYGVYSDGDMHVEGDFTASGTKNFVQTVETADGEKQVAYTAVEADRAQTETTGVAELEDGRAEIDLPEHFGMVTSDEEDLVVQLTPYEIDVPGLAVTERTTDHVVVESRDGTGEFEFSYTVRGVREGYEDTAVVRDSE
ncbi:hypothetical protein [Halorussus aquaticus]|uniref:Tat (Twin-arginine translocation) pathway signal sequence n=1 Tax=Halorussus aquaticus TaxID=2953748 RepID=A0ABD5Q099_9EURY|nr:hypothetical protein [Halorussus aquaticus]